MDLLNQRAYSREICFPKQGQNDATHHCTSGRQFVCAPKLRSTTVGSDDAHGWGCPSQLRRRVAGPLCFSGKGASMHQHKEALVAVVPKSRRPSLSEIGKMFQVSPARVHQIEQRALVKLARAAMNDPLLRQCAVDLGFVDPFSLEPFTNALIAVEKPVAIVKPEPPPEPPAPPLTGTWLDTLTRSEREVLKLVLEGDLNKQIARKLDMGLRTVELRRNHLQRKAGVTTFAALVVAAVKAGFVD
jgi:DNA-binding CsgD family transcriptional regulator